MKHYSARPSVHWAIRCLSLQYKAVKVATLWHAWLAKGAYSYELE